MNGKDALFRRGQTVVSRIKRTITKERNVQRGISGRASFVLMLPGILSCSIAIAGETCGLPSTFDILFVNGFDLPNTIVLPTPSVEQLLRDRAEMPNGGAPTVTITFPVGGATISDSGTDVSGTYTGPDNTGIAIGSSVAFTQGGKFVVPNVPLASGSNAIAVVATTLDGQTSTAVISVSGQDDSGPLTLTPSAPAGFAPFAISFQSTLRIGTIQSVAVDYDGDGTDDYTGSALPTPFSHTYSSAGVYPARLTITTVEGPVYTSTRRVVIEDLAAVKATVCGVFGYFRSNLAANQISTAASALGDVAKDRYTIFLNGLGSSNAATVATQLGTIANGVFGVGSASLVVVATENSELLGFSVTVAQGDDGVWRITSL